MKESTWSKIMFGVWAVLVVTWLVETYQKAHSGEGYAMCLIAALFCAVICMLWWRLWNMQEKAEKMIRCRDCRRADETIKYSDGENGASCSMVLFCDKHRCETREDFYCAWAVRR